MIEMMDMVEMMEMVMPDENMDENGEWEYK